MERKINMATRTSNKTKEQVNTEIVEVEKKETTKAAKKNIKYDFSDVDINEYIPVLNGFEGNLIYKSKKTGEKFEWDKIGDEQLIELIELKNAKSSSKQFFINNWFMFDDEHQWVIDYLGMREYYKNSISVDDFDTLFDKPVEELKEILDGLPEGQRKSLAYRASRMNAEGLIDSRKVINLLEENLGIDLSDKGNRVITNNSSKIEVISQVH